MLMKKILVLISVSMFIFFLFSAPVQANETETTNEMVKYALIVSLAPSINNILKKNTSILQREFLNGEDGRLRL